MKIKLDFVTNSSSTCFVVMLEKNEVHDFKRFINKIHNHPDASNEGACWRLITDKLDELREYTNDGPFDWASRPAGLNFYVLDEETYELGKSIIEKGKVFAFSSIDWNVTDMFYDKYEGRIYKEFL